MSDSSTLTRRRVLQTLGGASAIALAGCTTVRETAGGRPALVDPRSPPEIPADVSTQLRADVPGPQSTAVSESDHVRINMANQSPARHPMHLHGHFFQVGDAVKDTVIVPGHIGQVTIDFVADNPGDWFFHCHNLYHLEAGMARVIRYVE